MIMYLCMDVLYIHIYIIMCAHDACVELYMGYMYICRDKLYISTI